MRTDRPNEVSEMHPVVLFVEDDPDDVFLIQRAVRSAEFTDAIHFLKNGRQAVEYLESVGHPAVRAKLIFLDLNMPLMDGFELLKWLRARSAWQQTPVVVLTTSENPSDIATAYRLGANAYLVKPGTNAELVALLVASKAFWLQLNRP